MPFDLWYRDKITIITDFAAGIIPDYSLFCNKHRKEGERYYEKNNYREQTKKRKEAEKIDDDEWSDF